MVWNFQNGSAVGTNAGINTVTGNPGISNNNGSGTSWGNSPGVTGGTYGGTGLAGSPILPGGVQSNPTNWRGDPLYGPQQTGWRKYWNGDATAIQGNGGKANMQAMNQLWMNDLDSSHANATAAYRAGIPQQTGDAISQPRWGAAGGLDPNNYSPEAIAFNQQMQNDPQYQSGGQYDQNTEQGKNAYNTSMYNQYAAQGMPWMIPIGQQTPQQRQQSLAYWQNQLAQMKGTTDLGEGTNAYNLVQSYVNQYTNPGSGNGFQQNWNTVNNGPAASGGNYGGVPGVGGR